MCLSQEMLEKIKTAAAEKVNEAKPQCFVLFILSHGNVVDRTEVVYGSDGEHLTKTKIIDEVDNCPNLRKVPRLLFFQCCRGGKVELLVIMHY